MKKGWLTKTLGEICGFVRGPFGGSLKKSMFVEDGFAVYEQQHAIYDQFEDVRYFIDCVKFKEMKRFELHPNELIMSCSGTMGKVAIVPKAVRPGIINQALLKLTPSSSVLSEFLKYWMDSSTFQDSLKEQSGGAAIQNVASVGILKGIKIKLPPLPEQQRIVSILDEAFAGIAIATANAEKNLQNARALFESHLQSVFSQRGEGWVEHKKQLADLCDLIVDCEHKTAPKQEEGIPSIRTPNIGKGSLLLDDVYRVSEETYREWTRRAEPLPGDLILAREAPAGNVAVIPENLKVCLGQRTVLIRPSRKVFEPEFMAWMLLQPQMQKKLLSHSRGATVQHVNMKDIRALDVGAIPPLSVQRDIVSVVSKASQETQHLESIYQQKLAALDALKKSLLHQAFTGQL